MARWLNLPFNSTEFWDVVEGDLFPSILNAYAEDRTEDFQFKKEVMNSLFWIGNMLSETGTGVLNALGAKMTTSIGQVHLPSEWKQKMDAEKEKTKRLNRDPKKWKSFQ